MNVYGATRDTSGYHLYRCFLYLPFTSLCSLRWNERKLREIREEKETTNHRQRTSRLQKWREMAQEAAKEKAEALAKLDPNPQIEQLGYDKLI